MNFKLTRLTKGRLARGLLVLACLGTSQWCPGQSLSVEELADLIVSGETPFIIDLRRSHEFQKEHIPNAVNIPLALLAARRLPPVGKVVVYGEGLGRVDPKEAVTILEDRDGLEPFFLEGGYAAWKTRSGVTTASAGLGPAHVDIITYQDLIDSEGDGVVLYDLRKGAARLMATDDLFDKFPRAEMGSGSPYKLLNGETASGASLQAAGQDEPGKGNPLLRSKPLNTDKLIVLVDDDHETAGQVARRLNAGGFNRVAVLAGGDLILRFEGRSGLERRSGGSVLLESSAGSDAGQSNVGEENLP